MAETWTFGASTSSKYNCSDNQYRSDDYDVDYEEIDGDDDYEADYPCPFCSDDFDIVGLCCHIEEEHPVEAKTGVCPMCGASAVEDMVEHVVMEHENISTSPTKTKFSRVESQSILSLVRKEMQSRNRKSLLQRSSSVASSLSASIDVMLTSFISSFPKPAESESVPSSSANAFVEEEYSDENVLERGNGNSSIHDEEQEEMDRRCEFVRSLVFASVFGDDL